MESIESRISHQTKKLKDLKELILEESFNPSNANRDDHLSLMYLLYIEKIKLEVEIKTLQWVTTNLLLGED